MRRRGLPVEYSHCIKDSFYLKMCISFLSFFFQKWGGGGGGGGPPPPPPPPPPPAPPAPPPALALYFSFHCIYLPLIRSQHFRTNLQTFVNEISIRRFLTFTVSSNREPVGFRFHLPRDSLESKTTFVSQPINKEVGARK